ncbi:MAG: DUF2264 domain-containing protein [Ginsengibacter sp.]
MKLFLCIFTLFITTKGFSQVHNNKVEMNAIERSYLVNTLAKIADPVLIALSKNELKTRMPVESSGEGRAQFTHLEAFGRLLSGMAPWLELGPDDTKEGALRKKYIELARMGLHNATDSAAADYMNFNCCGQPVVDAAFLAQALLRAPQQLWYPLDKSTKANVIAALRKSGQITHYDNNWVMFSATLEAALYKFSGSFHRDETIAYINQCLGYYKGDGVYGDGENFHWDYYNSFVMQPMLIDVLKTIIEQDSVRNISDSDLKSKYKLVLKRAQRYAEIQEMLISPEGTYPVIGRSSAYRFGAFQLLSQIALMQKLPEIIKPQQVRAALYTLIKRQIEAPGTFDTNGWLQIGVYGHQPAMGEPYISTGSLYLCSEVFLMLGLPAENMFWQGKDEPWTSKKIWSGQNTKRDHAVEY